MSRRLQSMITGQQVRHFSAMSVMLSDTITVRHNEHLSLSVFIVDIDHASSLAQQLATLLHQECYKPRIVDSLQPTMMCCAAAILLESPHLLTQIRTLRRSYPSLPLLVVTAQENMALAVATLKEGATDCVLPANLPQALRLALEQIPESPPEEQFLQQLVSQVHLVFWNIAPPVEGSVPEVRFISPQYETVWGRSCASLYADPRSWCEAIHPDDREIPYQNMQRMLQGETTHAEYRILRPDGKVRWIWVRSFPIYDTQGVIHSIAGIAEDITDQQRAKQERDRFFELSPDLLIIRDLMGQYRYQNPAWEKVLGYSLTELWEIPFFHLIHPLDLPRAQQAQIELQTGASLHNFECRYRCKDGSYRWIASTVVPFMEEGLVYGIGRDITSQKVKEEQRQALLEALRQSEQRLSLHLQQTALAVIEWNEEGHITAWNTGAEVMFGFSKAEAMGQDIFTFLVPPQAHAHVKQVRNQLLQAQQVRGINENCTKDGRVILCEWHNTPLIDQDGKVVAFASFALNITERQHSEQALRESEARWRCLAENVLDPIITVDAEGRIGALNHLHLDCNLDRVLDIPFYEFIHPEYQEIARQALAHTFTRGEPSGYEVLALGEGSSRLSNVVMADN